MKREELIQALDRLKVQTGSLACLGCGYEHNCATKGCRLGSARSACTGTKMIHKDLRDLAIMRAFAANGQTMKMEYANILVRVIVANLSNERRRSCHKREMNR